MENITTELASEGLLKVATTEEFDGYIPTEVYKCTREPNIAVFSDEEKSILDRVVTKYGQLNGKQLEDLTHAEAPYLGTDLSKEITYELAFYRGTNFSE
jgi:uncharacterized phage-associated protein